MKAFSTEILLLIFNYLHFKQKLECILVCRAWANVLREGYLFEAIELSPSAMDINDDNYIRLLMKKAKTQSFIGNKCTRLLMNVRTIESIDAAAVASSFPNLRFLDCRSRITYTPGSRRLRNVTLKSDPFEGWKTSLETLVAKKLSRSTVSAILLTGTFKNLTTLSIVKTDVDNSSSDIITALKNVPALKALTIRIYETLISHLEELHKNTPKLISLVLEYDPVIEQNGLDRLSIEPAKNLKVLKVKHILDYSGNLEDPFLEYIKLKYTCLEEFSYRHSYFFNKSYEFPTSDWSEILSTLGSTLTKFTINRDLNSMPFLDLIPQHLNRLESLSLRFDENQKCLNKVLKSGSFYNLRSLSLYDIFITDLKLEVFENFTNLKEIGLHFYQHLSHWITLQDVIEKLPKSVETFSVECACIKASERIPSGHSSVVNLKLHFSEYQDERISFFLDQYFPKLKSLVLDVSDAYGSCCSLDLPSHRLRYVDLYTRFENVQITTQDKTRYFEIPVEQYARYRKRVVNSHDFGLQQALKASGKAGFANHFKLRCANVETVYHMSFLLLL